MKKFRGKRPSGEERKTSEDNINIKFDLSGKMYDHEIELFQHRILRFASALALATFEIPFRELLI
jgi:hypothetical protein